MKTLSIRLLTLKNLDQVLYLIKEVITEMERNNIHQWDEVYPDHKTIYNDIETETMYGIFKDGELAGIVVLSNEQSPEYLSVKWESKESIPLVMHRLCVHPKFQRQGIAKQILSFSEQFALDGSYKSIRLDAFSLNDSALNLYNESGYRYRGMVAFRKGNFHCLEKILT